MRYYETPDVSREREPDGSLGARQVENETARRILYHARLALLKHSQRIVFAEGDAIAIQLLANIEMGLAYNYSMPGRGI